MTPKRATGGGLAPSTPAVGGGGPRVFSAGISVELTALAGEGQIFECSVLENISILKHRARLLLVTREQIVCMTPNPFKSGTASVMEVYEMEDLEKLRFKRGVNGVLSLTFKLSKECRFLMSNAFECVEYIKERMSQRGIVGSHSTKSKGSLNQIQSAEAFLETTKDLIAHFSVEPSVALIQEIMELLRESAERFGAQNDDRYLVVVQDIKSFLQRDDVTVLLEGGGKRNDGGGNGSGGADSSSSITSTSTSTSKVIAEPGKESAPETSDNPSAPATVEDESKEALPTPQREGDYKPSFGLNLVELGASRTKQPSSQGDVASLPAAVAQPPPPATASPLLSRTPLEEVGDDELALELKKDLENMSSEFNFLLDSLQENTDMNNNEQFSLADLDSLMLEHGIRSEAMDEG